MIKQERKGHGIGVDLPMDRWAKMERYPHTALMGRGEQNSISFCIFPKEGSQLFIKSAPKQSITTLSIWANPAQLCNPFFSNYSVIYVR